MRLPSKNFRIALLITNLFFITGCYADCIADYQQIFNSIGPNSAAWNSANGRSCDGIVGINRPTQAKPDANHNCYATCLTEDNAADFPECQSANMPSSCLNNCVWQVRNWGNTLNCNG